MSVVLRTREGSFKVEPSPTENLLYAGLRAGVPLAYECATGTCGTCRARVKSGPVVDAWPQAPGRDKLKPEAGDILLCQTQIQGESEILEILVPGKLVAGPEHALPPRHGKARIVNLRHLNADVLTFDLELDGPIEFFAGQFVSLRLPGIDGYRAYSMTNYGAGVERLSFVVKNLPGGSASNLLFARPAAAEPLEIDYFGPLGGAIFQPEENKDVLCIVGGSGIAGIMAILRQAATEAYFAEHVGHLFFGVRELHDAFFLTELAELATASPGLQVTVALSDEPPPEHSPSQALHFEAGFVHQVAARAMAGRYENVIAYVAGPPPMVDRALRMLLTEGQLGPNRIRYDKFA